VKFANSIGHIRASDKYSGKFCLLASSKNVFVFYGYVLLQSVLV